MPRGPAQSVAVTGNGITEALAREVAAGSEPLSRSVLVPSVFRVYLHPSDWERLYPILHELRADAEEELDLALARLNKPAESLLARSGLRKAKPHRRVKEFWQIDFYANRDEGCAAGEFIIYSDFPEPPRAGDLEGGETVRATKYQPSGGGAETTGQLLEQAQRTESAFAQIRFTDELGRRSYLMTQNEVHIGRGGLGRWIDLELKTEIPDVSREHAIIRRNAASNTFEIKDVSRFGTTVNGAAVPQSKMLENDVESDKDLWAPLPAPGRIVLAGKFELDFQPIRNT
jgi:hypothetical protein